MPLANRGLCSWIFRSQQQGNTEHECGTIPLMFAGFGSALSSLKPNGWIGLRCVHLRCVSLIGLSPLQEAKGKANVTVDPSANGHCATGVVEALLPIPLENI
jgi:hypothetical protein